MRYRVTCFEVFSTQKTNASASILLLSSVVASHPPRPVGMDGHLGYPTPRPSRHPPVLGNFGIPFPSQFVHLPWEIRHQSLFPTIKWAAFKTPFLFHYRQYDPIGIWGWIHLYTGWIMRLVDKNSQLDYYCRNPRPFLCIPPFDFIHVHTGVN